MLFLTGFVLDFNIHDRVHFTGFQPDPHYWLNVFDVFVLPSLYEGFGISTLEALSHGLPVVVSDVKATNDLIQHNVNGLLFKVGDVKELKEKISEVLTSTSLRTKLSAGAKKTFMGNYEVSNCVQQHTELYEGMVKG